MNDVPVDGEPPVLELHPDSPVRQAALEVESHVAEAGWDQAPRLFALVRTAELIAAQPSLADQLGEGGEYTPIEQDGVPNNAEFESALGGLTWPEQVHGCAAVIERFMLPADADQGVPDETDLAAHPDRQEVRLVAAVLRDGSVHSAVRRRGNATDPGTDSDLLEGPDLVPGLVALLAQTLLDDV